MNSDLTLLLLLLIIINLGRSLDLFLINDYWYLIGFGTFVVLDISTPSAIYLIMAALCLGRASHLIDRLFTAVYGQSIVWYTPHSSERNDKIRYELQRIQEHKTNKKGCF